MSEEPSLTEWMDLEPYPGPRQEGSSEYWMEILLGLDGRYGNAVKTTIRQIEDAFSQVGEEALKGNHALVQITDELNRSVNVERKVDDRVFNHGPRPGSGYDLYGKKKY